MLVGRERDEAPVVVGKRARWCVADSLLVVDASPRCSGLVHGYPVATRKVVGDGFLLYDYSIAHKVYTLSFG